MTPFNKISFPTGAEWMGHPALKAFIFATALVLGMVVAKGGIMMAFALIGLPGVVFGFAYMMNNPRITLWGTLVIGFFATGIARYVAAPWGLMLDVLAVVAWLSCLFTFKKDDWKPLRNDIMAVAGLWYAMVLLQLVNPEARSAMAWFYAMRASGFTQLLMFGLTFMLLRHPKYLDKLLHLTILFSVIGTIWGLKQMIMGLDAAEERWLYVDGYALTHILHGVLRVFSFYSDAGQFGAQQAMMALICGVIAIGDYPMKTRIFYGVVGLITFVGFGISGTRGALAVPGIGAIVYLILSKNYRLLAIGTISIALVFYVLKFTFAFQGVEQVRRMRTALDSNDPSLIVRLENQKAFGRYLATRPFGGGIGSSGFWGNRFSPGTFLGEMPTDSYYVKIWAETGIIGVIMHMMMFGYFIGKGSYIIWNLRNPQLRQKILAIFAAFIGILMANYGNNVYSQYPVGIILYIGLPFVFMSPEWDQQMENENKKGITPAPDH